MHGKCLFVVVVALSGAIGCCKTIEVPVPMELTFSSETFEKIQALQKRPTSAPAPTPATTASDQMKIKFDEGRGTLEVPQGAVSGKHCRKEGNAAYCLTLNGQVALVPKDVVEQLQDALKPMAPMSAPAPAKPPKARQPQAKKKKGPGGSVEGLRKELEEVETARESAEAELAVCIADRDKCNNDLKACRGSVQDLEKRVDALEDAAKAAKAPPPSVSPPSTGTVTVSPSAPASEKPELRGQRTTTTAAPSAPAAPAEDTAPFTTESRAGGAE